MNLMWKNLQGGWSQILDKRTNTNVTAWLYTPDFKHRLRKTPPKAPP
jgi:hypothetical protein